MSQQVVKQQNTRMARRLLRFAGFISVWALIMLCMLASHPGALALVVMFALVVDGAAIAFATSNGYWFEWQVEQKWKKVCQRLGGNFVAEGRPRLQPGVSYDLYGSVKKTQVVRDKVYPKLRDVRGTRDSWTGTVKPNYGQSLDDFIQNADRFALALRVPYVGFDIVQHGLIRIRAGRVPIPAAYSFEE